MRTAGEKQTFPASDTVKGFGCRPVRDGSDAAVGRRSKASKGGNRGTRGRRRRCRDLWGFSRPLARVVRVRGGSRRERWCAGVLSGADLGGESTTAGPGRQG